MKGVLGVKGVKEVEKGGGRGERRGGGRGEEEGQGDGGGWEGRRGGKGVVKKSKVKRSKVKINMVKKG